MPTSRLEAFSDGVLAIIITIMVLGLQVPTTGFGLRDLWDGAGSAVLTYLLSFVYVGIYWNNHHHLFQLTRQIHGGVLWANLHLLFWLSLFPFTTAWMWRSEFTRTPVVVFGINLFAAALAYKVLTSVILRQAEDDAPITRAIGSDLKGWVSVPFYVVGIVAGAFSRHNLDVWIWFSLACYVAVAAMWLVPDRRIEKVLTELRVAE